MPLSRLDYPCSAGEEISPLGERMDYFDKSVALAWLALTYQQNRILARGNPVEIESKTLGAQLKRELVLHWPTIVGILFIVAFLGRPYIIPSRRERPAQVPQAQLAISGTAHADGQATGVTVLLEIDMPYEVFCTTDWNSSCYPQEKKDRSVILVFNTPAPPDGGKVEWHVTPIPPLEAYHDEVKTVAERDGTIRTLKQQNKVAIATIDALKPQVQTLTAQMGTLQGQVTKLTATAHDNQVQRNKTLDEIVNLLPPDMLKSPELLSAEKRCETFKQQSAQAISSIQGELDKMQKESPPKEPREASFWRRDEGQLRDRLASIKEQAKKGYECDIDQQLGRWGPRTSVLMDKLNSLRQP